MGVIYLLAYIAGGLGVTFGAFQMMRGLGELSPLHPAVGIVAVGVALIVAAACLHGWTEGRRAGKQAALVTTKPSTPALLIALALWCVPLIAAWAQFELFINPVHVQPELTVLGAITFTYLLARRVMQAGPMRAPGSMISVALFGVPIGLLTAVLPIRHFNFHLTDATTWVFDDALANQVKTLTIERDAETLPSAPLPTRDATLAVLEALGNAKAVDVEQEIAAGRMRRLGDGTLVTVAPDGSTAPIGGADDLARVADEAAEADGRRAAQEHDARVRAFSEELERRRQGGRLFHHSTP